LRKQKYVLKTYTGWFVLFVFRLFAVSMIQLFDVRSVGHPRHAHFRFTFERSNLSNSKSIFYNNIQVRSWSRTQSRIQLYFRVVVRINNIYMYLTKWNIEHWNLKRWNFQSF
jgi:hypothetical protein